MQQSHGKDNDSMNLMNVDALRKYANTSTTKQTSYLEQVFLIYANFSRLFLSAILYDLSAILQAFRLYDALKIRSTGSFRFLAIL